MAYNTISFDKRIKENIKNYNVNNLYQSGELTDFIKSMARSIETGLMLTDRHGEKIVAVGQFTMDKVDPVENPGRKVRVQDRTIAHLYAKDIPEGKEEVIDRLLDQVASMLGKMGEQTYLYKESSIYVDELEAQIAENQRRKIQGEKEDPLTGVFNKAYFDKRVDIVERSEVIPVALINVNINDWKFVNDHFGDEESDRLIAQVAALIKECAKPEYIIGRIDGDVFGVMIPMSDDGEGEAFAQELQDKCLAFEDAHLAPSVACGVVYRTNIYQTMEELFSDAEYEMLNNKLEIKNAPGYRERMESKLG